MAVVIIETGQTPVTTEARSTYEAKAKLEAMYGFDKVSLRTASMATAPNIRLLDSPAPRTPGVMQALLGNLIQPAGGGCRSTLSGAPVRLTKYWPQSHHFRGRAETRV
jgi:hypothetical protein